MNSEKDTKNKDKGMTFEKGAVTFESGAVIFESGAIQVQSGAIQVQSGANVQMGGTQTITQNFYGGDGTGSGGENRGSNDGGKHRPTLADFAQAVRCLQGECDHNGKALLGEKGAWYAVVRIGIDYFDFSCKLSAACESLSELGFMNDVDYESVRAIPKNYPPLNKPFKEWSVKECSGCPSAYQKQHRIGAKLLEILGIEE